VYLDIGEGKGMTTDAATLLGQLRTQLARHYPDWRATDLTIAGAGLTFLVCRAETEPFGTVAVRVPWTRQIDNDNDGQLDARDLLVQEARVTEHIRAYGVAAPAIHALHLADEGPDFLVSDFVEQDNSPPDTHAFGRLVRAIHACPVPELPLVEQAGLLLHERIAERLGQRAGAFARLTGEALPLPPVDTLADLLACRAAHRSLLHMDARPANLFTRRGAIVAIADWGNAMLGDPALELARIAESGHLDEGFLAGYGDDHSLTQLPPVVETLYRLDTAVMLANVFLGEAPDPEAARVMVARTWELAACL
jgi:aminoglycoside phosphotransferase (APT) family kinase protein